MQKRLIYFFTILFFSLTLLRPVFVYEPMLDYYKMKDYYSWMNMSYFNAIYFHSWKIGIPIDDICAIIKEESNGRQYVVSWAGAIGLMQVMPFHNKGDKIGLTDIYTNIYLGTKYYKWCLLYTKGNKREALRVYNAGPGGSRERYKNWAYVDRILKHIKNTKNIPNPYYVVR